MPLAHQLSQLRPKMTRAEIEALLGLEETKRALDMLSNPQRYTGVYVDFSHADEVIDSLTYTAAFNFPADVPVCGLRIGMTVDEMQKARPDMQLADGETGEPNERGFIRYCAKPAEPDIAIDVAIKDGKVYAIGLKRTDMTEALARRKREEAKRRSELDRKQELANLWKSIPNPDEMLQVWAEHCSPWNDYSPQRFVAFAHWLKATADPDIWHIVVTRWNWDYGLAPVLWIILQKNCDIATALEAFFLSAPDAYFRYGNDRSSVPAGEAREHYDFLTQIRQRLAQGLYNRSELAFDGQQHMAIFNRGLETAEDRALAKIFMPLQAGHKIAGRDVRTSDSAAVKKCYEMLATVN